MTTMMMMTMMLMNSGGVCVFPFLLTADSYGLYPSCPAWTKRGRIGCLDYLITTPELCAAHGNGAGQWVTAAADRDQCGRFGWGCLEPQYTYLGGGIGNPGDVFLSPKNESLCLAGGGVPTPYYSWRQGEWYSTHTTHTTHTHTPPHTPPHVWS
jgi:hypothetical protein